MPSHSSKNRGKVIYKLLNETLAEVKNDNILKYSASLAYYTIFSMGPMLLIIISLAGIFLGKEAIQGRIYGEMASLVGNEAALQIQETIKNIHLSGNNFLTTVVGVITLLIGASGIFGEIQDSINIIWGFKSKPRRGLLTMLINRILSFSMVVTMGFLLTVSLILNALIAALSYSIGYYFPGVTVYFLFTFNNLLTFAVITALFAIIFKVLPDAAIRWKDVRMGAFLTAILFMSGKFIIGFYLSKSKLASLFGAAGSLIIIMVWVYYNAIILYVGAEFTQVYARFKRKEIPPNDYAVRVERKVIEKPNPAPDKH
jgi:membrane protein